MNHSKGPQGLTPEANPDRWDALVGRIMLASGPELARRRGVFFRVRGWARPAVASAAAVAALAIGAMMWSDWRTEAAPLSLAEVVLPSEVVTWLDLGEAPTVEDFFTTIDEEGGAP